MRTHQNISLFAQGLFLAFDGLFADPKVTSATTKIHFFGWGLVVVHRFAATMAEYSAGL